MASALRTPLFDEHRRLGARMVEFAGWEMPLSYTDIRTEHRAVREAAGLFDLSHMGRVNITGRDRAALLDRLSVNRMGDLAPGRARYTVFCDEMGGAIDDLVVFCEADRHRVIPNAVNRAAVIEWLMDHAAEMEAEVVDQSTETGMLALQGPRAAGILSALGIDQLDALRYFHLRADRLLDVEVTLSRTGYTGEDGFEIIAPADEMQHLWQALLKAGGPSGLVPVGLGARDTLRLEAGLPLYGHELSREHNPLEAGLARFVTFDGRTFIGREALLEESRRDDPQALRLIGLTLASQRIPRTGQDILSDAAVIGEITSGTFSPTLEKPIAMGYVPVAFSRAGARVDVRISHEVVPATVTNLPFYHRRK